MSRFSNSCYGHGLGRKQVGPGTHLDHTQLSEGTWSLDPSVVDNSKYSYRTTPAVPAWDFSHRSCVSSANISVCVTTHPRVRKPVCWHTDSGGQDQPCSLVLACDPQGAISCHVGRSQSLPASQLAEEGKADAALPFLTWCERTDRATATMSSW